MGGSLNTPVVLGTANPGRVDQKTSGVGVRDEGLVEARLERVGLVDDRRKVVRVMWPVRLWGRRTQQPVMAGAIGNRCMILAT
jgi:hypothetical protein